MQDSAYLHSMSQPAGSTSIVSLVLGTINQTSLPSSLVSYKQPD